MTTGRIAGPVLAMARHLRFVVRPAALGTIIWAMGFLTAGFALASASADPDASNGVLQGFRKDDADVGRRLIYGLLFVLAVAAAGWGALKLSGKPWFFSSGLRPAAKHSLRLMEVVRISPKLLMAKVRVSAELVVVIADNGASIVKLAELHEAAPSDRSAEKP